MEFWKEIRRQVLTKELSQRAALKKYMMKRDHAVFKVSALHHFIAFCLIRHEAG